MTQSPVIDSRATDEALAREVVARTEFRSEAVWLPLMAVQHWNAGETAIADKTFTDCLIEGPAVLAVMTGTVFETCAMGTTKDVRTVLYRPLGNTLAGVVGMVNCRFVRCRFVQVGFTGTDDVLDSMVEGIKPMSEVLASGQKA